MPRQGFGVTAVELRKLKKQGVEKEKCRKCGEWYLYEEEMDKKELCGGDMCYSCLALRHCTPRDPALGLLVMLSALNNRQPCLKCRQEFFKIPELYKAELGVDYEEKHCPNCMCKIHILKKFSH